MTLEHTSSEATDRIQRHGRDFRTDYDYEGEDLGANFDDVLDDLVKNCPVAHSEIGEGYYVINRYEDVRKAAQDWETFSNSKGFMPNRPEDMPLWAPLESDPPLHDDLRKALNPYLSPKAIHPKEAEIKRVAHALIDEFIDTGSGDMVALFCNPFPGRVFCEVVAGMPAADMPYLQRSFELGMHGPLDERGPSMQRALKYITEYLERRSKATPKNDVVDALLGFEHPGYEFIDKAGTFAQLTQGGIGTTGAIFAGALFHLGRHPEDRKRLVDDPSLVPVAMEEFLRYYASGPQLGRVTKKDAEVADVQIPVDSFVLLSYAAASRDPAICPRPTEIEIERSPNRHMAFGIGIHRCIGSHLARFDLRVGLEVFLERIPDFTVDPDFVPHFQVGVTKDMTSLPLTFG